MSHSLVEISRDDWSKLLELYDQHRKEPSGYGLLQTFIKWIKKDPTIYLKILTLDDDWKQHGTFLAIFIIPQQNDTNLVQIYLNTLDNNSEGLTTALNRINLKSEYLLFGFSSRNKIAVQNHYEFLGLDTEHFKPDPTPFYHIEKEKALKFQADPPADYTFSALKEQHAEQVNAIWPHRAPGSVFFVKILIKFNESVGLFDKTGKLIAWCLRLPLGSLGLLQVVDGHKRQGLGNLIVRYMARLIASKDEEVLAPVVETNIASRSMFEKLGFTAIDNAYWIMMNN